MIPLRGTESLSKFPYASLVFTLIFFVAQLLSYFWPGPRSEFLLGASAEARHFDFHLLSSLFFHHHWFSLIVTCIYVWVFSPRVFERRGIWLSSICLLGAATLSIYSFGLIHPHQSVRILAPEALVGCLLGLFMRRDIWGTVTTFVIGPGWLRVFEVPSYVLLFFWFFYLLLGNLFLDPPFSESPMLYWIPFSAFLLGFIIESFLGTLNRLPGNKKPTLP